MRESWDWNESDLEFLIANKEQESLILDYKASGALALSDGKKAELSKDVSAFANSAGGTIVYGIEEDGHVPIRVDAGCDPAVISKEWIEQVINSRIQRRIGGIRIKQIDLVRASPGKVAYAIWIPQSQDAPHQASDKRFYKRFNFESVPMEEYELRDIANRASGPALAMEFASKATAIGGSCYEINPTVVNHALTPAEYVQVTIFLDRQLTLQNDVPGLYDAGDQTLNVNNQPVLCRQYYSNYGIPTKLPIFKGLRVQALETPLRVALEKPGIYCLGWTLASPHSETKIGVAVVVFDGAEATIHDGEDLSTAIASLKSIIARATPK